MIGIPGTRSPEYCTWMAITFGGLMIGVTCGLIPWTLRKMHKCTWYNLLHPLTLWLTHNTICCWSKGKVMEFQAPHGSV